MSDCRDSLPLDWFLRQSLLRSSTGVCRSHHKGSDGVHRKIANNLATDSVHAHLSHFTTYSRLFRELRNYVCDQVYFIYTGYNTRQSTMVCYTAICRAVLCMCTNIFALKFFLLYASLQIDAVCLCALKLNIKTYLEGFFMFSIQSGTSQPEARIRSAILYNGPIHGDT